MGLSPASLLPRLRFALDAELDAGHGFLWLPVALGIGILVYFALPFEPSLTLTALPLLVVSAAVVALRDRPNARRAMIIVALVLAGAVIATARTDFVAEPKMPREMTVTVSGWILGTEETTSIARRFRIAVAGIAELPPADTPGKVRITIRTGADALTVGDAVTVLASLSPPAGPVMPGGYDFSLAPYYAGLGGTGFAFGPPKPADLGEAPLEVRIRKPIADLREAIRRRVIAALPGDGGEIAAALIMGDQRGISDETQEAMRASGLGHIFSISGLHMALVAGSVFWLVRALLALSQTLALRYPIKKWAAVAALFSATFYLGISGAEVATVRSYVMLAIMLVAILLDRRALTLRNVALAALIILVVTPESLLSISFQMSFAATVALIAAYELIAARRARRDVLRGTHTFFDRVRASVYALFVTSLIAGLATAPFGAFYFHRVAPLTIIANMAVSPIVGLIIMPMVLFTVLALPFGLEAWPLAVMHWGIDWMVVVATETARWSSPLDGVRAPPTWVLLLMTSGFLWLTLWKRPWRFLGLAPMLIAVPLSALSPRPDLIVDDGASAVAVRNAEGALSILGGKGATFEIETWLRADADGRGTDDPELGTGVACDPIGCIARDMALGTVGLVLRRDAFAEDCRVARVVVSRLSAPSRCAEFAEMVIDRDALDRYGAHALFIEDGGVRVETAYPAVRRPFMPPVR